MTIKITSCSDPKVWYAKHIYDKFFVIHSDFTEYLIRTTGGLTNIVKFEDAEVVEDENYGKTKPSKAFEI